MKNLPSAGPSFGPVVVDDNDEAVSYLLAGTAVPPPAGSIGLVD